MVFLISSAIAVGTAFFITLAVAIALIALIALITAVAAIAVAVAVAGFSGTVGVLVFFKQVHKNSVHIRISFQVRNI